MYRGTGEEERVATWAVTATAGEVLERDGKLVDCRYMNSSGGHTQNSWEAWSGEAGRDDAVFDGRSDSPWASRFPLDPAALLDYLDDPLDDVHPWSALAPGSSYSEYRWVLRLSPAELGEALSKRHPLGQVLDVFPLERSRFGFVQRLLIHGTNANYVASSDYVRGAIPGLRSNLFYVETRRAPSGEVLEFLFHGGGWGHGVGFSQAGAAGMAALGKTKERILKYYFPGSRITRRY